jgi:hypothetical protein
MSALCQKRTLCSAATDRGMHGRIFASGWRGLQGCEGSKHLKLPNLAGLGSAEISFPERVDKGTYLLRCAAVQRPGSIPNYGGNRL